MKNTIIQILMFVVFLSLILNSFLVTEELKLALNTFFTILFPSIFPFFLISDILIEYNFVNTLNIFFSKITKKLFHVSGSASFVIIMSMLSGFPSGSKYIKTLYDKNLLTLDEANYLITFTHFANPLFVLTISKNLFNNTIPIYIILSMYISNIIIGIIIRPKQIKNNDMIINNYTHLNFSNILTNSIKNSIDLLIIILGNTCFFFLITKLITTYIPMNDFLKIMINGFFDITKGTNSLLSFESSFLFKSILIITFICFGGLNIHLQVKSIIADTKIKYSNFLLGRICQISLSILIFILFKTLLDI